MIETRKGAIYLDKACESGTGAALIEEQQTFMVRNETCALAVHLMEKICERTNLNQAYKHVKVNKGAPGVDGLTIESLGEHLSNHKERLIQTLLDGSYKPQAIRKVMIPKPRVLRKPQIY